MPTPEQLKGVFSLPPGTQKAPAGLFGKITAEVGSVLGMRAVFVKDDPGKFGSPAETELSEDEKRLLRAYANFRMRSPPGAVFSWKTPEGSDVLLIPENPCLLVDPREV